MPVEPASLATGEGQTEIVTGELQSLGRKVGSAHATQDFCQLQEGPVLVECCNVALTRSEDVFNVPVERKACSSFCEGEASKQLAVAGALLQHLVAARERSDFSNLAEHRRVQCAVE